MFQRSRLALPAVLTASVQTTSVAILYTEGVERSHARKSVCATRCSKTGLLAPWRGRSPSRRWSRHGKIRIHSLGYPWAQEPWRSAGFQGNPLSKYRSFW